MIYMKTGVGMELRGEDLILTALQSNFSKATFTRFQRITDCYRRGWAEIHGEIDQFFRDGGFNRDMVVLSIPRGDIIIRRLDLPAEVKDNLKDVMRYQVQSLEPNDEEGFYYDYVALTGEVGAKRLTVMVFMVRRSILNERLLWLQDMDIHPLRVVCASVGLANLYLATRKNQDDKLFFLIDIAATTLEIFALKNGQIIYSHEVNRNDKVLNELVTLEIGEAASRLRLDADSTIEKVLLSGAITENDFAELSENIPGCELLAAEFPFDTNEFTREAVPEALVATGLALMSSMTTPAIDLNLLPTELKRQQSRWGIAVASVLGVLILLLLIMMGFRESVQNRMLLTQLKEENHKLEATSRAVRRLETQAKELRDREKTIAARLSDRDHNLDILAELTTILPENTFLTSYTNSNGVITLVGQSGSSSDLVPELEKSPLLKDVTQKGVIYKDQATGRDRFNIGARMEMEK